MPGHQHPDMLPLSLLRLVLKGQCHRHTPVPDPVRVAANLQLDADEQAALLKVGAIRRDLRRDETRINIKDFGAGMRSVTGQAVTKPSDRSIASMYKRAAIPHAWGVFLFKLVRGLQPKRVLELGTNLGISACYLQKGLDLNQAGQLISIEGDPTLAQYARAHLRKISNGRPEILTGRFQDRLPGVLSPSEPFDLVFIDGHHDPVAVRGYVEQIHPFLDPGACIVLDDIEPVFSPVRPAWKPLKIQYPSAQAIDLLKLGLLIF